MTRTLLLSRHFAWTRPCLGVLFIVLNGSLTLADPPSAEGLEFFEKKVRPLFAQHCLECHGEKKQEMGVRLDSSTYLEKGGDSGPLIDRQKPDSSRLLSAITYAGDVQMPPTGKLSDDEIAAVRQWLQMGAPFPTDAKTPLGQTIQEKARKHWAFQPVQRADQPTLLDPTRADNVVDSWILTALEKKGLRTSPPADKATWAKRAHYDLTGLPPTYNESEAFAQDDSPDAHDRLLDRLLSSPHYGEKWARHWLDVARYADTKGYVFVAERRYPFAFTYRDYVIDAFNTDKPYQQFVAEQIAADQLDTTADPTTLAAMGFLTVGRRFLNNGHDIIDDRIDVVTRGLLGLSVTCARCHDHKYDPIPTADYYSLFGVFSASQEPGELPTIGQSDSPDLRADFENQKAAREQEVQAFLDRKQKEKEQILRANMSKLVVASFDVAGNASDARIPQMAQEIGVHERLVKSFIRRWNAYLQSRLSPKHPVLGIWAELTATPDTEFQARSAEIAKQLATNSEMASQFSPAIAKLFSTPPQSKREVIERYGQLWSSADPEAEPAKRSLEEPGSPFIVESDDVQALLDQKERQELVNLRNRIEATRVEHPGAPPAAMVMVDGPPAEDPHILIRGNPNRPGERVPRRFLACLESEDRQPFKNGSGRFELAQKIANPQNPLTSRVIVNRLWHWHFGRGLVRTTSDFGLRTEPPTHPELLDTLAHELVTNGGSLKYIHRLIMASTAYRQACTDSPEGRTHDPENDLLWSFRRRRLTFEEMRDSLLSCSGELKSSMHGRSEDLIGPDSTKRRAVYGFIDRQNLESLFRSFDFANPNTSVPTRFTTTVPQQALFFMNSPFLAERARAIALHPSLDTLPSLEHQVNELHRTILGREATADDLANASAFFASVSRRTPNHRATSWQYGFGSLAADRHRVTRFKPFEINSSQSRQPAKQIPHPRFGFTQLQAAGGHPGPNGNYAVIRRWTPPSTMEVQFQGKIHHPSGNGDGIIASVVSSRRGLIAHWNLKQQEVTMDIEPQLVEAGDTIDFVAEPGQSPDFDSFEWSVTIRPVQGSAEDDRANWNSIEDFSAAVEPMSPREKYAHVLLLTNEFTFVE